MRLVRYGEAGAEKPGLVDDENHLRDLSGEIADISGEVLSRQGLERLRAIDVRSLPKIDPNQRLGPPVAGTRNFLAVGRNYREHAAETGSDVPEEPLLFNKAVSSMAGPRDDIPYPPGATQVDWEVELAVVIGERCYNVDEDKVLDFVAGYCLCNDVSERQWQKNRGGQWIKGKSAPGFGPLGPWLVTRDAIEDPARLDLWLSVNGERRQEGTTADMIFTVPQILSYASRFFALEPGDIVTTGTPSGVAAGMKPPQWLKAGDIVTLGSPHLGEQRQTILG